MARIIIVTSGKGGVGKTNISVNLAARPPEPSDGSAISETGRSGNARNTPEGIFETSDDPVTKPLGSLHATIKGRANLPCMPQTLARLLHACGDDHTTPRELARISSSDPSLSAKIIQMVNSAPAGFLGKMKSLENGIVVLGKDAIRNIAITASLLQTNPGMGRDALVRLNRFWHHSFLCASIARRIAVEISYTLPEEAFLSGLLHDIGKLMLWVSFPSDDTEFLPRHRKRSNHLLEQEKALFGGTHSELGAWYIRQPPHQSIMADAVLYHHDGIDRVADAFPLVKVVYAANALSRERSEDLQIGLEIADTFFGFSPLRTEEMVSRAREETFQEARELNIAIEPADPVHEGAATAVEAGKDYQEELKSEIRGISLLQGTLQHLLKADSRRSILRIAAQGLQTLFNFKKVFFFSYDQKNDRLIGTSPGEDPLMKAVSDLEIPFRDQKGLIARSLLERTAISSFSPSATGAGTLADDQIINFLGEDGILCVPMVAQGDRVGVIVIGLSRDRHKILAGLVKTLTLFAGHVAVCLYMENIREEKIRTAHADFLETSEMMARRVTHEVANPLSIIKNYIKILELKFQEKAFDTEELRIINEEIERILHIVNQYSGFYRTGKTAREFVDINWLLSDLLKIMTHSILQPSRIKVHFNPDVSLPLIVSDKNSLKHVFINLIKNAAEAMTDGGNFYLEAKLAGCPDIKCVAGATEPQGNVEITLMDDGPGIPENIKMRLFEPFNTSKGNGHSGLGLSIAYNIIGELNGTMTWKNSRGKGTQFDITLPLGHIEKKI